MKLMEKIRKHWHDSYYFFASDKGVQFAMTCQEAAEQVDVRTSKKGRNYFRFYLHLSLCQGCQNYFSLTKALKKAIRNTISKNEKPERLKKLNQELLAKHCQNGLSGNS